MTIMMSRKRKQDMYSGVVQWNQDMDAPFAISTRYNIPDEENHSKLK